MRTRAAAPPLWVKVLVAVALVGPAAWWLADRHDRVSNQDRLAAIASEIAGREVGVSCPGWFVRAFTVDATETVAGTVEFDADGTPADETRLRETPCAELDALAEGRREAQVECAERSTSCGDDAQAVAWSVNTISHEAWHLHGIESEVETECRAVQTNAWTAMQLGLTEPQARGLARLHYDTVYAEMPERYHSPECRDGGAMDLRPDDPRWP